MRANAIDHLFTLQRSPIVLAPHLHNFYAHVPPRERNLLLSYLVLPMILYPPMQAYLINARSTSNLRTMCSVQSRLVGLTHQVRQFKSLTHSSLLVLRAAQCIEISDDLSVKSIRNVNAEDANPVHLEAASRLAKMLAEENIVSIYRTLGFKSL